MPVAEQSFAVFLDRDGVLNALVSDPRTGNCESRSVQQMSSFFPEPSRRKAPSSRRSHPGSCDEPTGSGEGLG